jgi:putative head protein|nr:MAG TPA: minor capsid protein [Caudoviricetes sp.]
MGTDSYWARRSVEREEEWNKKSRDTIEKELASHYERSAQRIQANIERLYGKFSTDNGVSISEARKLINGTEYRTWKKDIEEYIAEYKETGSPKTLLELNTLAMRSRISRLDKLYGDTLIELDKLGSKADKAITGFLKDAYKDNRLHSAYELAKKGQGPLNVAVNEKHVEQVLRAPWSGKNYSERIWGNNDKLARTLQDTVFNSVHRGDPVEKLAKEVQERMNVGKNDAVRLVRTELNYVHNQATLDSLKSANMGYFQFIATLDKRTSSVCREHDNHVYPIDEAEVGTNVPPLHPRCRSTIAGSIDSKKATSGSRTSLLRKGEYQKVPRNMDYDNWKAVYVDNSKSIEEWKRERKPLRATSNGAEVVVRKAQDLAKVEIGGARVDAAVSYFDKPNMTEHERMSKNLMPLSDSFLKIVVLRELNASRLKYHKLPLEEFEELRYTIGKDEEKRWFSDPDSTGRESPLYPPNEGAVGTAWAEVLQVGTKLTRFGRATGRYTAPAGTPFVNRAMPYTEAEYSDNEHQYVVIKPLPVKTSVTAPAFNKVGGGIQYKTEESIQYYLDEGYLEEVD